MIAVNSTDNSKLQTYPNPVRNELNLNFNSGNRRQLSFDIFDASGKQVYHQSLGEAKGAANYLIDVAGFTKGIYYVNMVTNEGIETARFIKN